MAEDQQLSRYLAHVPAILQQDPFVGRLLLAFERMLSGLDPPDPGDPIRDHDRPGTPLGLEEVIDRLHSYFEPGPGLTASDRTPREFLTWLASWVALSLREDWQEEEQRRFLSRVVPLYRKRGTKAGLEDLLRTYTGEEAVVFEFDQPPHYFQVRVTLGGKAVLHRKERIARAIIEQGKPAESVYTLKFEYPDRPRQG